MTEEEREAELRWMRRMIALEEEHGDFLPNGYAGGVAAIARAKAEGRRSTALDARQGVRFVARALPPPEDRAA